MPEAGFKESDYFEDFSVYFSSSGKQRIDILAISRRCAGVAKFRKETQEGQVVLMGSSGFSATELTFIQTRLRHVVNCLNLVDRNIRS